MYVQILEKSMSKVLISPILPSQAKMFSVAAVSAATSPQVPSINYCPANPAALRSIAPGIFFISESRLMKNHSIYRCAARLCALASVALIALATPWVALAQTSPTSLNDTGITSCYGPNSACNPALHFKQDAMVGRDAAARIAGSGLTTNTGKGFSFTKISLVGAALPDSAALGNTAGDWACTRDNVTGLVWEIKTTSSTDVRYKNNNYTWFNPDNSKNGGNAGEADGGFCPVAGRCDTDKYIQDLRTSGICGKTNWRLPTPKEFLNIYDLGNPVTNVPYVLAFFPNVPSGIAYVRWTSVPDDSNSNQAWVAFENGTIGRRSKSTYNSTGIMAVAGP